MLAGEPEIKTAVRGLKMPHGRLVQGVNLAGRYHIAYPVPVQRHRVSLSHLAGQAYSSLAKHRPLGHRLAEDTSADFFTTDYAELLKRPEVNAAIIATDENRHVGPVLAAVEQGHALFIEKPLATDARESLQVLTAIQESGVDAVAAGTGEDGETSMFGLFQRTEPSFWAKATSPGPDPPTATTTVSRQARGLQE